MIFVLVRYSSACSEYSLGAACFGSVHEDHEDQHAHNSEGCCYDEKNLCSGVHGLFRFRCVVGLSQNLSLVDDEDEVEDEGDGVSVIGGAYPEHDHLKHNKEEENTREGKVGCGPEEDSSPACPVCLEVRHVDAADTRHEGCEGRTLCEVAPSENLIVLHDIPWCC